MDLPALETALPAATLAAVAADDRGLTLAAHVYVDFAKRQTGRTTTEAFWRRPTSATATEGGLGQPGYAWLYVCRFERSGKVRQGTTTVEDVRALALQLQDAVQGRRFPSAITGLEWAEVAGVRYDSSPATESANPNERPMLGARVSAEVDVIFHGRGPT